ncbi:MAG: glutamate--cysteine ligase [Methyloligellaceae bacterium]
MTEEISGRDELIAYLEQGNKEKDQWRIGTEHEKFAFHTYDNSPLEYEGPDGVKALLTELQSRFGWEPIMEGENIIGLKQPGCPLGGSITLEPGGQIELSGAPLKNIHETCSEVHTHLRQVKEVGEDLGIGMLGLGVSPKWTREETPQMPKARYGIMTKYMPTKGKLGLDMMYRSCTVQVNLDFSDEADMVKKFRVSMALQPIATALFASSPFLEGKPNGYLSYRSEIWKDTDPDRSGMLPFVFEEGMSFERYVEYALDVPMYFVYRDGKYLNATGKSFRDFLEGKLDILPGEKPNLNDWTDHLTTLFPEVRLKRFLEMRGADGGAWRQLCGLPALWVGLLYDSPSLEAAWALVRKWSFEDLHFLRRDVPKTALNTRFRSHRVLDFAKEILKIADDGLKARDIRDKSDDDERQYLTGLQEIVDSGKTEAEIMLHRYNTVWDENIDRIFEERAY